MANVLLSPKFKGDYGLALGFLLEEAEINPDELARYTVIQIDHFKEKDNIGHEFLVMRVDDGTGPILLRAERRPSTRKPAHGFSTTSAGSPYVRIADDTLSRLAIDFRTSTYYHITSIPIPPGVRLTLLDVAQTYGAIAATSRNYDLWREQCYWFAVAFLFHLVDALGIPQREMRDYDRKGKFAGHIPIVTRVKQKAANSTASVGLANLSTPTVFVTEPSTSHDEAVNSRDEPDVDNADQTSDSVIPWLPYDRGTRTMPYLGAVASAFLTDASEASGSGDETFIPDDDCDLDFVLHSDHEEEDTDLDVRTCCGGQHTVPPVFPFGYRHFEGLERRVANNRSATFLFSACLSICR